MPVPKRRKNESFEDYKRRVIKFYIAEGYPQKQAVAIAYNQIRKLKKQKGK